MDCVINNSKKIYFVFFETVFSSAWNLISYLLLIYFNFVLLVLCFLKIELQNYYAIILIIECMSFLYIFVSFWERYTKIDGYKFCSKSLLKKLLTISAIVFKTAILTAVIYSVTFIIWPVSIIAVAIFTIYLIIFNV